MDRIWAQRGVPYKTCLVALLGGICPFLLGFSAPDWLWFNHRGENGTIMDGHFGLWEMCVQDTCVSNPIVGNLVVEEWFLAVVVFQSLALPFYVIALLTASLQNFAPRRWLGTLRIERLKQLLHKDSETPEDLAFVAGFLSFLGIIVFMIMTSEDVSKGAYYSWGFAMSFIGATIPVIAGVLMCKTHSPSFSPPVRPAEPRVVHTHHPPSASRRPDRGERRPARMADQRYRR